MVDYSFVSNTPLFRGINEQETVSMLNCLGGKIVSYPKEMYVYHTGDHIRAMGLILSGSVNIEKVDVWGNCNIIENIDRGQVFAETYACAPTEPLTVNVVAAESCEILFLDIKKVLQTCPSACDFHSRLVRNLLTVMAGKNLALTRKMNHITPKSIRARLLSYFSYEAIKQGKYTFTIPFNRQQLADYLSVERSALSNELSKMRSDGLLEFQKNTFTLKCGSALEGKI